MIITYHGGQCFKVSFGDVTLAFNPASKKSSLSATKFGADVVFSSMNHPDFNGVDQMEYGNKKPFVVNGPGEYEVGSVTARGFDTVSTYDKKERHNSIFQVRLEDMNLLFLGALNSPEIDPKILSEINDVDILFTPISGGDMLEVPQASKLAVKLEAKIVIPMHFDNATLKEFLKEESVEGLKPIDKLSIKRKDLSDKKGEVVVLK